MYIDSCIKGYIIGVVAISNARYIEHCAGHNAIIAKPCSVIRGKEVESGTWGREVK